VNGSLGTQPMTSSNTLMTLNILLSEYVDIHTEVFTFSFRRIIPIPGIFKKQDWSAHATQLKRIAGEIDEMATMIASRPNLPAGTSGLANGLLLFDTYCGALCDSVMRLFHICSALREKADGTRDYSISEYNQDVTSYEHSVETYQAHGSSLNDVIPILDQHIA